MVEFKNILFPTDFSVCAEHAQEYAFALAKNSSGTIHALHVVDRAFQNYMGLDASTTAFDRTLESIDGHARTHLAEIIAAGSDEGIDVRPYLERGKPDIEIAALATGLHCDLVVMATHGRSGIAHAILGSTTEKAVRLAPCPVLTIRPDEAGPAAEQSGD